MTVPISIHALREEGDKRPGRPSWTTPYFYPRPPRGGRRPCRAGLCQAADISIHALREEGDVLVVAHRGLLAISIHALREEGDDELDAISDTPFEFLSTPSARRATVSAASAALLIRISIHALREEGDMVGPR